MTTATSTKSKVIRIQPAERSDMKLPYPFFIESDGSVQRQDFWKGKPLKLIGFDINPSDHGMSGKSIDLSDFIVDPQRAVGMYPIFEHADGNWFTYDDAISSVQAEVTYGK